MCRLRLRAWLRAMLPAAIVLAMFASTASAAPLVTRQAAQQNNSLWFYSLDNEVGLKRPDRLAKAAAAAAAVAVVVASSSSLAVSTAGRAAGTDEESAVAAASTQQHQPLMPC